MKIGIIGGTGFYSPGLLEQESDQTVVTPYGDVVLKTGVYQGQRLIFLARHGADHALPPHLINYRANIWALKAAGVEAVLATAAVGSLNEDLKPGEIVLVDQFLDFTRSRPETFFEGGEAGVLHVDMTQPYCPALRRHLATTAHGLQLQVHSAGTYVCTEGPRYETPAEIKMFRLLGGDVVGMTSVPEVVLAREAELCYATLSIVTNYAAGISQKPLSHQEVVTKMAETQELLRQLIFSALVTLPQERDCNCSQAAAEVGSLGESKK
jgi:5'-methylthioadenosine phosphorylase